MDLWYKIILVGKEVKNQLIKHYINKPILDYEETLGLKIVNKTIKTKKDKIDLDIWNLSNQEVYKPLIRTYCEGAHGAIYIIDQEKTETIEYIKEFIKDNQTPEGTIELLMTTLEQKMNDEQIIKEFGKPIKQFPISIETGEGINEAFNYLIKEMINKSVKNYETKP